MEGAIIVLSCVIFSKYAVCRRARVQYARPGRDGQNERQDIEGDAQLVGKEDKRMEVITKDEIRLDRNKQAQRIEGYRFRLWMIERKRRRNGYKRIH